MTNTSAKELFESQFKFNLNQELRHKGDNKHGMSSDMGLLVLRRSIEENADDDGNVNYTRYYVCRMIRFSGSGDLAQFKESELLSISDYNRKVSEEEEERNQMRNEMHWVKSEVMASFGVSMETEVYLKVDGQADKTRTYKVSGYRQDATGTFLKLRLVAGQGRTIEHTEVKSNDDFEVVKPN